MQISQKSKIRAAPRSFSPDYLLQQTEELLNSSIETKRYMINRNNTIFSNPIDMTKDGYIFPVLPYPYTYVKNDYDNYYHIEFLPSQLLTSYTPTPSNVKVTSVPIKKPARLPVVRTAQPIPIRNAIQMNVPAPGPHVPVPAPGPGPNVVAPGPLNKNTSILPLPRINVGAG